MDFGERLKRMRTEHGMTQQALGDLIGTSTMSIRSWEHSAKKPSLDALVSLSLVFNTPIEVMLGIDRKNSTSKDSLAQSLNKEESDLIVNFRSTDAHGRKAILLLSNVERERVSMPAPKKAIRFIPKYATPSAAGCSFPLDGSDFEMIEADDSVPTNADYAVRIQGDSMFPYIHDGDTVYVEKDAELAVGDVGIFSVDGAMYCKIFFKTNDGTLILASANEALKETNVIVSKDSGESVQACGKVILKDRIILPEYLCNLYSY